MPLFGNHSKKEIIIWSVLGIIFGLISYMTITLSTTLLLYPLLLCMLYCKGGFVPVLVSIAAYAASFTAILGPAPALMLGVVLVLPALLTIIATAKQLPYFTQLKVSVFGFAGGVIALLLGMSSLTGGNLVDAVIEMLNAAIQTLPVTMQDGMLTMLYPDIGPVSATGIPVLGDIVRNRYWTDFFNEMRGTLLDQMLPMLLQSSLTTAFLGSYLTARSQFLRGNLSPEGFVSLDKWAMPGHMCAGILLTTFAAYLYDTFLGAGSVSTFLTMFTIMECVFAVQGMAAWDRLLVATKAGFRRKLFILGGAMILAPSFLSAIGICSALFGRRGLLIKMKKNPPQ